MWRFLTLTSAEIPGKARPLHLSTGALLPRRLAFFHCSCFFKVGGTRLSVQPEWMCIPYSSPWPGGRWRWPDGTERKGGKHGQPTFTRTWERGRERSEMEHDGSSNQCWFCSVLLPWTCLMEFLLSEDCTGFVGCFSNVCLDMHIKCKAVIISKRWQVCYCMTRKKAFSRNDCHLYCFIHELICYMLVGWCDLQDFWDKFERMLCHIKDHS